VVAPEKTVAAEKTAAPAKTAVPAKTAAPAKAVAPEKTVAPATVAAAAATARQAAVAPEALTGLKVSRKFDAAEALRRLAAGEVPAPAPQTQRGDAAAGGCAGGGGASGRPSSCLRESGGFGRRKALRGAAAVKRLAAQREGAI